MDSCRLLKLKYKLIVNIDLQKNPRWTEIGLFPYKPNCFPGGTVRYATLIKCNSEAIIVVSL